MYPVGVLVVPLLDLLQDLIEVCLLPLGSQLLGTAPGPDLRRCRQEDLHGSLRQHHGADVPAIHDDVIFPRHRALHIQQGFPDDGMSRNQTGFLPDFLGADISSHIHAVHDHVLNTLFIVFDTNGQFIDVAGDAVNILGRNTPQVKKVCYGAVNGTGIHIMIAQFLCQTAGNGGLTSPRRAINGDGDFLSHSTFLFHFM